MKEKIESLLTQAQELKAETAAELEALKVKYLGRKGIVQELFQDFKNVPPEEKRETGQKLNELKESIQNSLNALKERLESKTTQSNATNDLTLPVDFSDFGARHPLSIVRNQICAIFGNIGYTIAEGPEIEDDWHNFTALNFPLEHPARDMQDTFFIEKDPDIALRTHTSSVQIRMMETINTNLLSRMLTAEHLCILIEMWKGFIRQRKNIGLTN